MTTTFIETLIRKMHLDDSRIITLTGAGGKTTLLYALAGYLSRTENTLLTTTTHIMEPRDLPNAILVTREDAAALRAAFLSSRLAALGIPVSGPSGAAADRPVLKWRAPSLSFLEEIRDIPARIVCEGDGSRRMPVKIPRPGEPVLYPGTDTVIGVIGLSCLGQPASECLFGGRPRGHRCGQRLPEAEPATGRACARGGRSLRIFWRRLRSPDRGSGKGLPRSIITFFLIRLTAST